MVCVCVYVVHVHVYLATLSTCELVYIVMLLC